MQTLPVDRQKKLAPPLGSARSARRALAAAFASFTQTAGALETTYTKLQAEVGRLRHELENKNRSLAQSLEENQRMRTYLAKIVEGLPCGVLVFDSGMNLRMINPAASRLLDAGSEESPSPDVCRPSPIGIFARARFPRKSSATSRSGSWSGPQGRTDDRGDARLHLQRKGRATTPFSSCAT